MHPLKDLLALLLRRSTVKLTIPDRPGWGTGVFVSPDLVLTCFHVVKGEPSLINVHWQKTEATQATVVKSFPDPIDLALLRLSQPNTEANYVYLDRDQNSLPESEQAYFFGYPDKDYLDGCPALVTCEGLLGGEFPLIKFKSGQVRPGMSGSPMLNLVTGKVFGIVKSTRDRSSDLGGDGISATVIFQYFPELIEYQKQSNTWQRMLMLPSYAKIAGDLIFDSYVRSGEIDQDCHEDLSTIRDRNGLLETETRIIDNDLFLICKDIQRPKIDDALSKFEQKISEFFQNVDNFEVALPQLRSKLKGFGISLGLKSDDIEEIFNLALCNYIDKKLLLENIDAAITLYEQSANRSPEFEQFHIGLGIAFSKKKKFKLATKYFLEAERILNKKDIHSNKLASLIEDAKSIYKQKFSIRRANILIRFFVVISIFLLPLKASFLARAIFIVVFFLMREILARLLRLVRKPHR